jgi:hypothetical protein
VIVSASVGPGNAYSIGDAESYVYRKDENGKKWNAISKAKGEFYAANNRGLFFSVDSGISWRALDIVWPKEYYLQPLWALAVSEK